MDHESNEMHALFPLEGKQGCAEGVSGSSQRRYY